MSKGYIKILEKNRNTGLFELSNNNSSITTDEVSSTFGSSVTIGHDGRTIAVSSPFVVEQDGELTSTTSGKVQVYHKTGTDTESGESWQLVRTFTPPQSDDGTGHFYGNISLAKLNNELVVGAKLNEKNTQSADYNSGGLFVYTMLDTSVKFDVTETSITDEVENKRDTYVSKLSGQLNISKNYDNIKTETIYINNVAHTVEYDNGGDSVIKSSYGVFHIEKTQYDDVRNWYYYPEFDLTANASLRKSGTTATVSVPFKYEIISNNDDITSKTFVLDVSPGQQVLATCETPTLVHNSAGYYIKSNSGGYLKYGEGSNNTVIEQFQYLPTQINKGDWAQSVSYVVNDVVRYNGSHYVAIQAHTSTATPPPSATLLWGEYTSNNVTFYDNTVTPKKTQTIPVKIDTVDYDTVFSTPYDDKHNQIASYTFTATVDQTKCGFSVTSDNLAAATFGSPAYVPNVWNKHDGDLTIKKTYSASVIYQKNDMVYYGGKYYVSLLSNNQNKRPDTTKTHWAPYSTACHNIEAVYTYNGNTGYNNGNTRLVVVINGVVPFEHLETLEITGKFNTNGVLDSSSKTLSIKNQSLYENFLKFNYRGTWSGASSVFYNENDYVKRGNDYYYATTYGTGDDPTTTTSSANNWKIMPLVFMTDEVKNKTTYIFNVSSKEYQLSNTQLYTLNYTYRPLSGNMTAGYYSTDINYVDKRVGYFGFNKNFASSYTEGNAFPQNFLTNTSGTISGKKYNLYSVPSDISKTTNARKSKIVLEIEGDVSETQIQALSIYGVFGETVEPNSTMLSHSTGDLDDYSAITFYYITSPDGGYKPSVPYTLSATGGQIYPTNRVSTPTQMILKTKIGSSYMLNRNNIGTTDPNSSAYGWAGNMSNYRFTPYGTNGNTYTTWEWENSSTSDTERLRGQFLPHTQPYVVRFYTDASVYWVNAKKYGSSIYTQKMGYDYLLEKDAVHNTNFNVVGTVSPRKVKDYAITGLYTEDGIIDGKPTLTLKINGKHTVDFIDKLVVGGTVTYDTASTTQAENNSTPYLKSFTVVDNTSKDYGILQTLASSCKYESVWVWYINSPTQGYGQFNEGAGNSVEIHYNSNINVGGTQSETIVRTAVEDHTIVDGVYRTIVVTPKNNNILDENHKFDMSYKITGPINTSTDVVTDYTILPTHIVGAISNTFNSGGSSATTCTQCSIGPSSYNPTRFAMYDKTLPSWACEWRMDTINYDDEGSFDHASEWVHYGYKNSNQTSINSAEGATYAAPYQFPDFVSSIKGNTVTFTYCTETGFNGNVYFRRITK